MNQLVPLLVAAPISVAVLLAAFSRWLPKRLPDIAAIATAAGMLAVSLVLLLDSLDHRIVYWFGDWRATHDIAIGVGFVLEPLSASLAALVALLGLASLIFSWRYFEEVGHLYHSLMLALLAGLVGFALSADLFNIFVWLELMSVAAYALCGYQVHQPQVIQGAVNFAVINSLGSASMLLGIALVYGETGALNLSAIGHEVAATGPSATLATGFALVTVGFLVKAGAVPFHFWLSDAYAVAAAPVGAVFAGVMSDLAYHTFARVYWDAFAPAFGYGGAAAVRTMLLAIGVVTAVVGALMCVMQADLKRMVAFLTVSHGGIFLAGIAFLKARGLGGATLYVISDGLLKTALFLSFAVVIKRLGSSNEFLLRGHGRRRDAVPLAVIFAACGLGLATLPPFGTFVSAALLYDVPGYGWLPPLLALSIAITSAAVLRAGARIFLGWGPAEDPLLTSESDEPEEGEPTGPEKVGIRARTLLLAPAFALVVAGYGLAFAPAVAGNFTAAAVHEQASHETERVVLEGARVPPPAVAAYAPSRASWAYGGSAAAAAVLLAALALWWPRLLRRGRRIVLVPARMLKSVHDGALGDYAAWFTAGAAVIALTWTATLR